MFRQKAVLIGILVAGCLSITELGHAATINANSCSQANVQAAINSASNGDTVSVPAGTCTWSSQVTINNKTISVIGAGINQTNITETGGGSVFTLTGTQSSRISGFTFDISSASVGVTITGGSNWRIDNCTFDASSYGGIKSAVYGYGQPGSLFQGLIDNCTFYNGKILHYGEPTGSPKGGYTRWSESLDMGTEKAVYIEDCTFTYNTGQMNNAVDTNHGGRYVFRFNRVTNHHIECHSMQGYERGTRLVEIYGNVSHLDAGYPYYYPYRIRGGTGVIFNNELTGSWDDLGIALDNARSYASRSPYGQCDGNAYADGNEDATGWPCRDQIGRSTDDSLWDGSDPAPDQASVPMYLWLNRVGENILPAVVINDSSDHIKNNRDFYDEAASFNGSSGIGYGTLASRPATCTTGVAYWATDQGDWNKKGDDGVLYKCTSTNTWEEYYTPYTYPHPLQKPSPPLNLRISN